MRDRSCLRVGLKHYPTNIFERTGTLTATSRAGKIWEMQLDIVGTSRRPELERAVFISGIGRPPAKDKDRDTWKAIIAASEAADTPAKSLGTLAEFSNGASFRQLGKPMSAGP